MSTWAVRHTDTAVENVELVLFHKTEWDTQHPKVKRESSDYSSKRIELMGSGAHPIHSGETWNVVHSVLSHQSRILTDESNKPIGLASQYKWLEWLPIAM